MRLLDHPFRAAECIKPILLPDRLIPLLTSSWQ